MTKLTLTDVANLQNESTVVTTLKQNNDATEAALDNTLSRDGTSPNQMLSNLDMNNYKIINLPDALTDQEPATYSQLQEAIGALDAGAVIQAPYVTISNDPTLTNDRVLTGSTNISVTDGGANNPVVLDITPTVTTNLGTQTLSNKTLDNTNVITVEDTNFTLQDNADTTKQAQFDLSSISPGNTRTLIVPDTAGTMITASATQTLSNKTLNNTNTAILQDTNFTLQDNLDNTKQAQFQLSGITTGATRTYTLPNISDTLITGTGGATFTNKTIDTAGPNTIKVNGNTLAATAGTATVTVPNSTDTLVGRATTDTLTNKTFDTAGVGNTFKINGTSITANTGTGSNVLATSPTLVTPALGTPTALTLTNATGLPVSGLASQTANTLVGNFTGSTAIPTATAIGGLSQKLAPSGTDLILIQDNAAAGQLKYATLSTVGGGSGGVDPQVLAGYITGLTLSTAGSSSVFSIASGACIDSTSVDNMKLLSSYTKTTSAWAVGSANGALDTGAISTNTWYHVHLIKRTDTGVVDVLISLSATSPTLPTNYTLFRRIGSMLTNGSSQWVLFHQLGNEFLWDVPVANSGGTTTSTTPTLCNMSVPTGIQVNAIISSRLDYLSAGQSFIVYSPDVANTAPGAGIVTNAVGSTGTTSVNTLLVRTNTSGQIKVLSNNAGGANFTVTAYGWVDTRGAIISGGQSASAPIIQNHLTGLILSTAGSSTTFSVASGQATDSGNVDYIALNSSISKTTSAWAVGSGNGALDTGAIAASTWYHVYLIKRPDTGVVDVLISLSATSPTMPANYTLKRRIGSLLTNGSSQWTSFIQLGDEFLWNTVFTDVNGVIPGVTTASSRTLTVPSGIQVIARIRANSKDPSNASAQVQLSSLDESDQTTFFNMIGTGTNTNTTGSYDIRTNTSSQIRMRQSTTTVAISIWTYGWIDNRGKL